MKIRYLKHKHYQAAKPYCRASAWIHARCVEKATADGYFDDLEECDSNGTFCACDSELTEPELMSLKCASCGLGVCF